MPIPLERTYHYKAELLLSRSRMMAYGTMPKDDIVNWLFAHVDNAKYGFVYRIENVETAVFERPFLADISFLAIKSLSQFIREGNIYDVSRGEEKIGSLTILESFLPDN